MARSVARDGAEALALLESPVRRSVVDLLANLPDQQRHVGLGAAHIAEHLGLHVTTARFHLDQLEAHRLVESWFRHGAVGRPRKLYRVPSRSLPAARPATEPMQALSALLAGSWGRTEDGVPPTPEQAGRHWALREAAGDVPAPAPARTPGAWLGKVGATLDLLRRWGYLPELRTEDGGRTAELTLVDCPFLALAREHPDVVCAIHRGLLRGALEAVGEEQAEVSLQPLVAPRTCRARITTRVDFG